MDFLEEWTTSFADLILANSKFTARIVAQHLPSIKLDKDGFTMHSKPSSSSKGEGGPRVIHPGINLQSYSPLPAKELKSDELKDLVSQKPTFLSLNRFEGKKNIPLAVRAFALFLKNIPSSKTNLKNARLVLGGGYDPRLNDNRKALNSLFDLIAEQGLSFALLSSSSSDSASDPLVPMTPELLRLQTSPAAAQVLLLPNFSTSQRSYLLTSEHTIALLYTPQNEHFGIVPIEAMAAGLPVLACNSGGPTESVMDAEGAIGESVEGGDWSVVDLPSQNKEGAKKNGNEKRTGWLRAPDPEAWSIAMLEAASLSGEESHYLALRCKSRAEQFSLPTMAASLESALLETYALGKVEYAKTFKKYARIVGWVFCILVFLSWFILGSYVLVGTEVTVLWIAGLGGWGWYKGWWAKLATIS